MHDGRDARTSRHTGNGATATSKAACTQHDHERPRNPLVRPGALRRAAAAGVVGAAVTAGGLAGTGQAAAADPVTVDTCTEQASSDSFGQPIVASPKALDAKVQQATLLVFPLQFDRAERTKNEFLNAAPVSLGTVTDEEQTFSGAQLADALAPRISKLSTLGDRADEVNQHVRNLASLGCLTGVEVPGQDKPEPSPSPSSSPEPDRDSAPTTTSAQPRTTSQQPPASSDHPTSEPPPAGSTPTAPKSGTTAPPAARSMVPSDYAYIPGSLPPWSQTRFGQPPGSSPQVGDLLATSEQDSRKKTRQEQVRAAGSAEALPTDKRERVALPVLIAAIALAGATSALVRTWVLRRP
ncbi:hypothetical protein DFQ14_101417 [Halopolyspora algeriensis]|uniref:Uncharacterized protein n=1 Tax=Halopolyspora algeriensis TaxID=1500506 RepID=A0A368W313_9ACTN|nr:hypothetical protein [Halopolyspora algeriensis]RCW47073.1 hypothetical protein DFQ14_101417 [Halopolyspora algeriensis]TQM48160.1 hypothetical protein FHU43_3122 [Halopolyspora algeriensis]